MRNNSEILLEELIDNQKSLFEFYKNSPRIAKTKTDEKIVNYLYEQQVTAAATLSIYTLFPSIFLAQDNFERSQNTVQPYGQFILIFNEKSKKDNIVAKIVNKNNTSKNYDLSIKISNNDDFRIIYFNITENNKRIFSSKVHESFLGKARESKNLVRRVHYTEKTNAFRMLNFFKNLSENANKKDKERINVVIKSSPIGQLLPFIIEDNYTFGNNTMKAIRQTRNALKKFISKENPQSDF